MISRDYFFFILTTLCLHTVIWFQVFLSNTNNFQNVSCRWDLNIYKSSNEGISSDNLYNKTIFFPPSNYFCSL